MACALARLDPRPSLTRWATREEIVEPNETDPIAPVAVHSLPFHISLEPPGEKKGNSMPVPFEAFIPMGLVVVMFGITGTGFNIAKRMTNDGKPQRHGLDDWEHMMMKRDERLTGSLRGQSVDPVAPPGFATNSIWETERVK